MGTPQSNTLNGPPPSNGDITQRLDALCAELAPLAEQYEAAEIVATRDPRIRALRQLHIALSLGRRVPSLEYLAAAGVTYKAAIPALEEILPRFEECDRRFTILQLTLEELVEDFFGECEDTRSQILGQENRDLFLKFFGLMGIMTSLVEDCDAHLGASRKYEEEAKCENVGSREWADGISLSPYAEAIPRQLSVRTR